MATHRVAKLSLGVLYLPVVQITPQASIFIVDGVTATADTREGATASSTTDRQQRGAFEQNFIEAGMAVGGCETNEELRLWLRNHDRSGRLTGTTRLLELEIQRMTCSTRQVVYAETRTGDWELDITYPEITPIWLDFAGVLTTIAVEFQSGGAQNFTAQEFANYIAEKLAPRSTIEFTFDVRVVTWLTATTAVHALGTQITVEDTADFAVGDTVIIHNGADTRRETRTVQLVLDGLNLVVDALSEDYYSTDVLSKSLATA